MTDYKTLTDTELLEQAHQAACSVSYYNAAEGSWSREAAARGQAKQRLKDIRDEMTARGLEFVNRGYLL